MKRQKKIREDLTLIYGKGRKYWVGNLLEKPEIASQGRTLKELVDNIKDAVRLMNKP